MHSGTFLEHLYEWNMYVSENKTGSGKLFKVLVILFITDEQWLEENKLFYSILFYYILFYSILVQVGAGVSVLLLLRRAWLRLQAPAVGTEREGGQSGGHQEKSSKFYQVILYH